MKLSPTHRARTPYLFHFDQQSVALGEAHFLGYIDALLRSLDVPTQTTYWDQVYLAQMENQFGEFTSASLLSEGAQDNSDMINSVGAPLTEPELWEKFEAAIFAQMSWPTEDEELYLPSLPEWLQNARSWEFDPVAPAQGPGNIGGWVRTRGRPGAGQPVGLFQLTDPQSFWVLGSPEDLASVHELCLEMARIRSGFQQTTAYLGHDLLFSSLALPLECRQPLEEELYIAGIDAETLFWE